MGEKDIAQKNFEAYNDVVADIVNGSLFDGREIIKADSLVDAQPFSQYKADDGTLHEQERDVAKYCMDVKCNVRLALIGFENQIAIDWDMPIRVFGYDGDSYRDEMNMKSLSAIRFCDPAQIDVGVYIFLVEIFMNCHCIMG